MNLSRQESFLSSDVLHKHFGCYSKLISKGQAPESALIRSHFKLAIGAITIAEAVHYFGEQHLYLWFTADKQNAELCTEIVCLPVMYRFNDWLNTSTNADCLHFQRLFARRHERDGGDYVYFTHNRFLDLLNNTSAQAMCHYETVEIDQL